MNDIKITLTGTQKQLILGTLLGTSSIIKPKAGKNAYLQLRQKKSGDVNWLRCKAEELSNMARPHPFVDDKDSWHWASVANPILNDYLELCYKNGNKTVTWEWLNPLRDRGHAAWFLDKGAYENKLVVLNTSCFGEKGNKIIQEYLNLCGYECEVNINRKVRKIIFTNESSERYLKLILPCFPKYLLDLSNPLHNYTSK